MCACTLVCLYNFLLEHSCQVLSVGRCASYHTPCTDVGGLPKCLELLYPHYGPGTDLPETKKKNVALSKGVDWNVPHKDCPT